MANTIKIILLVILASCSSLPKGELVNAETLEKDRREYTQVKKPISLNKGKVIYIKIKTYPQLLANEHIFLGGEVMLNVGREDVTIKEILNGVN